jgi:hypothetical protein
LDKLSVHQFILLEAAMVGQMFFEEIPEMQLVRMVEVVAVQLEMVRLVPLIQAVVEVVALIKQHFLAAMVAQDVYCFPCQQHITQALSQDRQQL